MATIPPAPTPPQPSERGRDSPPPCPQHAAIPFSVVDNRPAQDTNPPPGAQNGAPGCVSSAAAPPQLTAQNEPQPPPPEEPADSPRSTAVKVCPVQETDPAPQAGGTPAPMDQDRKD